MSSRPSLIAEFLRLEAASGILLFIAAALALIMANSPLSWLYAGFLDVPVVVQIGVLKIAKPLLLWINDGLMAIFFLLVGLEIKREIVEGELSSWNRASLPVIAAIGGMAVPALVYVLVNSGNRETLSGWAIPAATDIAFALGVLSLLGARAPATLKIFLLALAIIDDLGAIIIIAVFYTYNLSLESLALAAAGLVILAALNRRGVTRLAPYMLIGLAIWVCVLKSGVHATLAGVAVAFFIPVRARDAFGHQPLKHLEHLLHPWVSFAIMPIFAFANAGVSFGDVSIEDAFGPVSLGIAAGLFLGKQIGVMATSWLAVRAGLCELPVGVTWTAFYGVAVLTGIGFTMSLFIGTLAFEDPAYAAPVRIGVLAGSVASAVVGYICLSLVATRKAERADMTG